MAVLAKIKIENFKSFKESTTIDFTATKYTTLKDTNVENNLVKGCLFVGANASGKTNAINAISILLDLLFTNAVIDIGVNFCVFSKEPEMKLNYTFIEGKDEIQYFIGFDRNGIITKEQLLLNNEVVLDRIGLNAETKLTDNQYYNKEDIEERTLFLKSIYFNTKFTNFPALKKWFEFLSNSVYFNAERLQMLSGQALSFNVNNKVQLKEYLDLYGVEHINKFFDYFGFNQKIAYQSSQKLSEYVTAENILGNKDVFMKRNDMEIWMPIALESMGNKTLLSMLPGLLHVVECGGMFIVDEFSSAFHNELEELIIHYFMRNAKNAQMFFVSHSTNLLKNTLLRPDQIYTVSFYDNRGSKVKRVSSEQPRESQNLEKMYLGGVFGGLPKYKTEG